MGIESLREQLPEFAKDIKLNISSVLSQIELTPRQAWGTALACARNSKNAQLYAAVLEDSAQHLNEQEINAANAAASLMAMNNIYYRFGYLSGDSEFASMPARLRMGMIRGHGVDAHDFELWCLAVSSINGCGKCVESHWQQLRDNGISREVALAAIRIAAVINALSVSIPL